MYLYNTCWKALLMYWYRTYVCVLVQCRTLTLNYNTLLTNLFDAFLIGRIEVTSVDLFRVINTIHYIRRIHVYIYYGVYIYSSNRERSVVLILKRPRDGLPRENRERCARACLETIAFCPDMYSVHNSNIYSPISRVRCWLVLYGMWACDAIIRYR